MQGLIEEDAPDRIFRLTNKFKEAIANNTMVVDAGSFFDVNISEKAGKSEYKFLSSLCLEFLQQALKYGATAYVAYATIGDELEAQTVEGDPDYVRFFKVNLTAMIEKKTDTTKKVVSIVIEDLNLNVVPRTIPFVGQEDLTDLEMVNLKLSPIAGGDSTVVIKATACDLLTPVTDILTGVAGVHNLEFYANGVLIPGALAAPVGNLYTFTRTAGTFTAAEVVTAKHKEPSVTTVFYVSNTPSTIVTV